MARLNDPLDSDDELPELSALLRLQSGAISRNLAKTPMEKEGKTPSQRKETQNLDKPQSRKQRPLGHIKHARLNSLFLPIADTSTSTKSEDYQPIETADSVSNRVRPRRSAQVTAEHDNLAQVSATTSILNHHDDSSSTDLSGFIVPDSASDEEELVSSSPKKKSRAPNKTLSVDPQEHGSRLARQPPSNTGQSIATSDDFSPEKKKGSRVCLESPPSDKHSGSELVEAHPNVDDRLSSSSPRIRSPYGSEDNYHPITPPSSPSKSTLKSPSKQNRIPPSPHRPSIDAFWSQDVINDWNEQYSPRKNVNPLRRHQLHGVDEVEESSPSESPRKSPTKSPAKRDKKFIEQRKLFDNKKTELATAFLAEVDEKITNGQVASMAHSTGGIQIIWSKKLSSTAGRANWRREVARLKNTDGTESNTTHRHHASIELAEKVIDNEDRLVNVIAHEYCHLANFMISGIKDNPHGKEFKEWARKCTDAFSHRAINVTTKHTYTIAYKYIWICMLPECGLEYKRHSKSIDPSKNSCGNCKGKLVQVQPAPREGKRSEYQGFVKRENERVRLENPGAAFGEIMSILGREFKERRRHEVERASGIKEDAAMEKSGSNELESLDSVVRKLDFLNLES